MVKDAIGIITITIKVSVNTVYAISTANIVSIADKGLKNKWPIMAGRGCQGRLRTLDSVCLLTRPMHVAHDLIRTTPDPGDRPVE